MADEKETLVINTTMQSGGLYGAGYPGGDGSDADDALPAPPAVADILTKAVQPAYLPQGVIPSPALYVSAADVLVLRAVNGFTGAVTMPINARIMLRDGTVQLLTFVPSVPANPATTFQFAMQLPEGWLLEASVSPSGYAAIRGLLYAALGISRGTPSASVGFELLCADHLTGTQGCQWPGGFIRSNLEGPGYITTINFANPGAGAEINAQFPTGFHCRLISFSAQLVTSVAAANRQTTFRLEVPLNSAAWYSNAGYPNQVAASTYQHVVAAGVPPQVMTNNLITHSLPTGIIVDGTCNFRSTTAALQAGDQWTQIYALVEQWALGASN